ncbi:MAG: ABC transporter permease [Rhodovulum sulfidophilum]|uniref:ABC transporter permease n=1 Tax=Rhodovulum sulfidophilum TaxID=35806 RepID=A0A2W5N257_RHOSU|nr:MAG: ABC transporter permease [Rhodovulum sulfidophilum]
MMLYALRRVLYTLPIALGVSLICFLLVHIAPGDPISAIVPPDAPRDVVEQVRAAYGLDRPLPVQYLFWLSNVLRGDFGLSLATGRPVLPDLLAAAAYTLRLALAAALIAFLGGALLGTLSAATAGSAVDRLLVGVSALALAVPNYWVGMALIIVFSVLLNWLPSMGAGPGPWAWDAAHLQALILPALALATIPMGMVARAVRGGAVEILNQEFVTTLRSKGMLRGAIVAHVAKNAAPGVLAVAGLQLGQLMGGSVLVETVFSWPGTGFLLNTAIAQRDIPMLQATTLLLALFFVLLNLAVDLVQAAIDPRFSRS